MLESRYKSIPAVHQNIKRLIWITDRIVMEWPHIWMVQYKWMIWWRRLIKLTASKLLPKCALCRACLSPRYLCSTVWQNKCCTEYQVSGSSWAMILKVCNLYTLNPSYWYFLCSVHCLCPASCWVPLLIWYWEILCIWLGDHAASYTINCIIW